MTSEDLRQNIFDELNEMDISSWHGITKENIERFLIEPEIIELVNVEGKRNTYWNVFDESPDDKERGYSVIYDERAGMFGLATKTSIDDKAIGLLVGVYGSFIDTLNAM